MMRVSRTQAVENRKKVIDVASRLFREHGFDGVGLNDLMKAAGLTQGGFYKQFESKEDLAAQACARAMERGIERWAEAASGDPEHPGDALLDFYLGPLSRKERADGCPMVALGADAWRHGDEVKAAFKAGFEEHLTVLEGHREGTSRAKTMAALATMVGALLLSRAVGDENLSDEILSSAKAELTGKI